MYNMIAVIVSWPEVLNCPIMYYNIIIIKSHFYAKVLIYMSQYTLMVQIINKTSVIKKIET
jgi:hypothetical protein